MYGRLLRASNKTLGTVNGSSQHNWGDLFKNVPFTQQPLQKVSIIITHPSSVVRQRGRPRRRLPRI